MPGPDQVLLVCLSRENMPCSLSTNELRFDGFAADCNDRPALQDGERTAETRNGLFLGVFWVACRVGRRRRGDCADVEDAVVPTVIRLGEALDELLLTAVFSAGLHGTTSIGGLRPCRSEIAIANESKLRTGASSHTSRPCLRSALDVVGPMLAIRRS